MIRIEKIIYKDDLFDYINNPSIVKVVINQRKNAHLVDNDVVKVYVFYRTNETRTIIASCGKIINNKHEPLPDKVLGFLNGIASKSDDMFITKSQMVKLIDFQYIYRFNLNISKKIKELIKKD